MATTRLTIWIEGAIVAALAMVLSMIPTNIGSSFTISLGMIPLTIYALRRGLKAGLFSGLMWGLLHFLLGSVVFLAVSQVLVEYVVAFVFAGFAGLYGKRLKTALLSNQSRQVSSTIVMATFVGCLARFFWHFIAGVIFWGEYALWGLNPWWFSLIMNGVSGLATAVVTGLLLLIIVKKYPQIFIPK
ncbi:energy-coupled thiamine transporter ThiT [Vagococcus intermedius]|uniref:Energy-coupled thiamine transporter ThiT n=2 Tax=Vagococcus intermedius TaxID=2991418 RepID=A0AAF0CUU9_9ENTE|nr:energy-coupled thiamine transporter ThiT [Vagococcus intermedius]WEG73279.1 energy-coupled thiamine transporter ThiT [Vagococcus intermedius]